MADFFQLTDTIIVMMKAWKFSGVSLWFLLQVTIWGPVVWILFWELVSTVRGGGE